MIEVLDYPLARRYQPDFRTYKVKVILFIRSPYGDNLDQDIYWEWLN